MVKGLIRLAAAAATVALLTVGGPAFAELHGPKSPNDGTPPSQTPTTTDSPDSTVVDQVNNCSVVSSPSYLGLSCAGGEWNKHSIKETLDGDKLPHCWHDKMTPAETEAMNLDPEGGSTWYWWRCMEGVDPQTLTVGPDGVSFTTGWIPVKDGDAIITLTHNQELLVAMFDKDGQIPSPVAGVSPMAHPRVGSWVSFFDGTPGSVEPLTAGKVQLKAGVVSLKVEPLGEGITEPSSVDLPLTCSGTGYRAHRGDAPDTAPGCWFRYERSSAAQPAQAYAARITAHWLVQVSADGGASWTTFNEFDKSQITTIPVTEIEALVVN